MFNNTLTLNLREEDGITLNYFCKKCIIRRTEKCANTLNIKKNKNVGKINQNKDESF